MATTSLGRGTPRRWCGLLAGAAVALLGTAAAWAVDPDLLRREQAAQSQATQIARDLIRTTLDVQVRQLEDNRLAGDNPLYQEVVGMRSSIDALMAGEMRSVVELIEKARTAEGPAREQAFAEARGQVREIVGRLSEERSKLRRRLRVARLSADARQVLQLQVAVHEATNGLGSLQDPRKLEAAALRTIQDQRNVQLLFMKLNDLLVEVAEWGPPSGPSAVRGLQMVKSHRIDPGLRQAVDDLENVRLAEAAARQKEVIAGLEAVLARVDGPAATGPKRPPSPPTGSAAELAVLATKLQALHQGLEPIIAKQQAAFGKSAADPAAAAAAGGEIATLLEAARGDVDWPDAVDEWLDQAIAASGEVAAATDASRLSGPLARASEALARLDSEAAVAAEDANRAALAVRVGELNRAIEVLERAAASQRRLATRSRAGGIAQAEAATLAERQQAVSEITASVAEAVPDVKGVDALVAAARTAAAEAGRQLATPQPEAEAVARAAEEAAGGFGKAADALREKMQEAAAAVDAAVARQLAEVKAVEADLKSSVAPDSSAAARLARLEKATKLVRRAAIEQLRAEGRGDDADLREARDAVEEAVTMQAAADAEATRAAISGGTPLEAAARQQAVADTVNAIATKIPKADPAVREALARAVEAASVAASETVSVGPAAAEPFRRKAREALEEAIAKANRGLAEPREPSGPPNPAAQDKVTALAEDATGLAESVPEAEGRLKEAVKESTKAAERGRAKDEAAAKASRNRTSKALDEAGAQLAEASKKLAEEVRTQVAAAAAESKRLAVEASQVAPKAGSALREAAAAQKEPPDPAANPRATQEEQAEMLDEARSELAARRKALERDRQLAADLAKAADKEAETRGQLAEIANAMAPKPAPSQASPPPPPGAQGGSPQSPKAPGAPTPPTPQPPAATGVAPPQPPQPRQKPDGDEEPDDMSKALTNALTEYADAQKALGENAEKLSKQKEIKNQPLRKALERAEELAKDLEKAKEQEFIPTPQPLFAPSNKPPLPEQSSTGGVVPKQGKQDPEEASTPKEIPPQTQGPQNPASTQESPPITPNAQEQLPADKGPMATQTVQTAPVTSSAQQATPPSAADVFQPNEGAPKSATPTSRSSPPEGKKPKPPAGPKPPADQEEKEEKPKKRVKYKLPDDVEPPQLAFTPPKPMKTAAEIAGPEAQAALEEPPMEEPELPRKEREPKEKSDLEEDEGPIEEVVLARSQNPPAPPEEQPGETGTTPGDLGMGQGTPGKGVGGDSASPPTEQRPQQGDQHGKFDGREIEGDAPPMTPQGKPPGAPPPPPKPGKPPKPPGDPPPDELPGKAPEASNLAMPEVGGSVAPGNPADVNQVGEFTPGAPVFAEPQAADGEKGPEARDRDADAARDMVRDPAREAWFGKLPPGVQKALRSEPPRPLPRGYEDRLRKYLRNVE